MKTKKILLVSLLFSMLIISCNKRNVSETIAESSNIVFDSTSSVSGVQDPTKKFIHKADIGIEVKNVLQSTLTIEKNVTNLGGYVAKSDLKSDVISENVTPISKDSARETKVYSATNFMTIRIPKSNLTEFLLSLNQEIGFITFRNLEITDVTTEVQIIDTADNTPKKLKINSKYERNKMLQEGQLIEKYRLNDQIRYATVSIYLMGKESIKKSIIANTKNYNTYEDSNFGYKLKTALYSGTKGFLVFITALLYLWPFGLILIIGYVCYKKYKKTTSK